MANLTFLYGPISHPSSWLESFGYGRVGKQMGVVVLFLDGFACIYQDTTVEDYQRLRRARSKGRTIHKYFYHLDYTPIDY